jgi:predicted GIY-YIG superfamily endonuclease
MVNTILNTQKPHVQRFPQKWLKNDTNCNQYFVYVLKLENGELYIGHTRELQERLIEHKEGMTPSTAGQNPKLRYFEILPNRDAAINRELELQQLLKHNRRGLIRILVNFQSLVYQIDLH